jgi:hypothetical protein
MGEEINTVDDGCLTESFAQPGAAKRGESSFVDR